MKVIDCDIPADERSTRNCFYCKAHGLTVYCLFVDRHKLNRTLDEVMKFPGFLRECKDCKDFDNDGG